MAGRGGKSSVALSEFEEAGERFLVGVNEYSTQISDETTEILKFDPEAEKEQCARLEKIKNNRNNNEVQKRLKELKKAAEGSENLMPYILNCVREYASVGEIIETLKDVFGVYREDVVF